MEAIQKFMNFVIENWTMICAAIVIGIAVYEYVQNFRKKSKEEQEEAIRQQIEIAKQQVREIMLRLVTEAENDYLEWVEAGEIKRSQVIDIVFEKYPILSKVTNQQEIIDWLDQTIKDALKTMRKIFEENENQAVAGKYSRKKNQASETAEG